MEYVVLLLAILFEYSLTLTGVPLADGQLYGVLQCTTLCTHQAGYQPLPCLPLLNFGSTLQDMCNEQLKVGFMNFGSDIDKVHSVEFDWTIYEANQVKSKPIYSISLPSISHGWVEMTDEFNDLAITDFDPSTGCIPGRLSMMLTPAEGRPRQLAFLDLLIGGECNISGVDVEMDADFIIQEGGEVIAQKDVDGMPYLDLSQLLTTMSLTSTERLPSRSNSRLPYSMVGYITPLDYTMSKWHYDSRNDYCPYPSFAVTDQPVFHRFMGEIFGPPEGNVITPQPGEFILPLTGHGICPMCGHLQLTIQFDPLFDVYDRNSCSNFVQLEFYVSGCEDEGIDRKPSVQLMPDLLLNGYRMYARTCQMYYQDFHLYDAMNNSWVPLPLHELYDYDDDYEEVSRPFLLARAILDQYKQAEQDICDGLPDMQQDSTGMQCDLDAAPDCKGAIMATREWVVSDSMPPPELMQNIILSCAEHCPPIVSAIHMIKMFGDDQEDSGGESSDGASHQGIPPDYDALVQWLWMIGLGSPLHGVCPDRHLIEDDMMHHPGNLLMEQASHIMDVYQRADLGLTEQAPWPREEQSLHNPMACAYERANHLLHLPYAMQATQDIRQEKHTYYYRDMYYHGFVGQILWLLQLNASSADYLRNCLLPSDTEPIHGLPAVFYDIYEDNVVAKSFYNYLKDGDSGIGNALHYIPIGMVGCPYCGDYDYETTMSRRRRSVSSRPSKPRPPTRDGKPTLKKRSPKLENAPLLKSFLKFYLSN